MPNGRKQRLLMKWGVRKAWYVELSKNINSEVNLRCNMCEFCEEWKGKDTICGSDIPIYYAGHKDSTLTQAQILKNCADDRPGIVIYSGCKAMGYFDIKFCPMCGIELSEV